MLDEFKQQQEIASLRERSRLTKFVGICVVMAMFVVGLHKCSQAAHTSKPGVDGDNPPGSTLPGGTFSGGDAEGDVVALARLDVDALAPLVSKTLGGGDVVERTETYAEEAIELAWRSVKASPGASRVLVTNIDALRETSLEEGLGRAYEFEAIVVSLTPQVWQRSQRLWSTVLAVPDPEGEYDGRFVVAVTRGRTSDPGEGRPHFTVPRVPSATPSVEVGDNVKVRGYFVQRRTGTVGTTPLAQPTPVLLATAWRAVIPIEDRRAPPASLDAIDFERVRDRYREETRREVTLAQRRVLQWAQHEGHEAIAAGIADGTLEVRDWDESFFAKWEKEVEADASLERPVTEGARGTIFRFPGHIGSFAAEDWTTLGVNAEGVAQLEIIDIIGDYYGYNAIRTYSAFPRSTYPIEGTRGEYATFYGVFVKNFTFAPRKKEGEQEWLTTPSFVLLHADKREVQADEDWQQLMWIIALVIVILGLLFWLVLVRGESREAAKMDARRRELRQRQRAARKTSGGGSS